MADRRAATIRLSKQDLAAVLQLPEEFEVASAYYDVIAEALHVVVTGPTLSNVAELCQPPQLRTESRTARQVNVYWPS